MVYALLSDTTSCYIKCKTAKMPRVASTKSYGRDNAKDSFASRAFDAVLLRDSGGAKANKAASAIKKWGATSFTSTRGTASNIEGADRYTSRKRKAPEVQEPDSMFDDPFSFDSDDDAPKKPKRGLGFKKDEPASKPTKTPGSSMLERDENNEEKDSITNAPSRTYSKGIKLTIKKLDNGSAKQLSLEACFAKQSKNAASTSATQGQFVERKFFRSRSRDAKSNSNDNILKAKDSKKDKKDRKDNPAPSRLSPNFFDEVTDEDEAKKEINLVGSSQDISFESRTDSPIVISASVSGNEDNDTDSVSSQQEDNTKDTRRNLSLKSYSQSSVASNGSNNSSSSICDTLKWDNRPVMKISSLDREAKDTAAPKPLVRRLLTGQPKKVGIFMNLTATVPLKICCTKHSCEIIIIFFVEGTLEVQP